MHFSGASFITILHGVRASSTITWQNRGKKQFLGVQIRELNVRSWTVNCLLKTVEILKSFIFKDV